MEAWKVSGNKWEYLRFLIHFNSQEEFMTAVDMDEFLEVRNILDGSIL